MTIQTSRSGARFLLALVLLVLTAALLTACGGDGDDSTSASSAETGQTETAETSSPGLEEAQKEVDAHIEPPSQIGPTEPVENVPSGKNIVFSNCGVEGCVFTGEALTAAADELGWNVETIDVEPTPQGIQAFFKEAIRKKPDAVVSIGFPKAAFQRELAELEKLDIPVVSTSSTDEPGEGIVAQVTSPDRSCEATELVGDKMVVDSGGEGTLGFVILTGYPIVEIYTECAIKTVEKRCPDCVIETLEVTPEQLGVDAAETIANWLRANPDIEAVFLSYDPMAKGLKTAVANVGSDMPTLYSWSFSPEGLEALRNGERKAAVSQDYATEGWQIAYVLSQVFTGGDPDPPWAPFTLWAKEFDNIPPDSPKYAIPPANPNFEEQFKELWGL